LNKLKHQYNLRIQKIEASIRRNANTFRLQISEGTQSSVSYQQGTGNIFEAFFGQKS